MTEYSLIFFLLRHKLFYPGTRVFKEKKIDFTNSQSSWILEEKLLERNVQDNEASYRIHQAASAAWAIYVCKNVDNPAQEAIMKIYMQIPYAGSEFDPPEHRQSQATATGHLTGFAASELSALKLLTEKACPSTPTLLDYKHDIQGPEGLVPGGNGFNAGLVLSLGTYDNLMWDDASKKIYFTGFQYTHSPEPDEGWDDEEWDIWGLRTPPTTGFRPSSRPAADAERSKIGNRKEEEDVEDEEKEEDDDDDHKGIIS
ncbi:Uncharacterized protein T310_1822 [Rasamsonia emersonii CBS 393.64]|uniref:Uncharacterized protein n=1 Tax=Rasamsonia emersonii (strain ATCC 16479 / CBS 393.64 / IMI 116815) TaxID=1408163 RepID=A0A0F4Z1E5_RASE3|nr:Uncharacterized protein T310_1822 [Rasamsonia emersonii CBS 393.64]KKA24170.1 Uncharacterized protein T310_1822 [Rasamsonia emersonii CBS 393.64]